MGRKVNGWSISPRTLGRYGLVDSVLLRAVFSHAGVITFWAEDAFATNTATDANGMLLDGGKRYLIRFTPDQVPEVKGSGR